MRRNLVLGNWKQNTNKATAAALLNDIKLTLEKNPTKTEIGVVPPALYVDMAFKMAAECGFNVGVQNISAFDKGAYTGEIGAEMAASCGAKYALIGHSERREYFNENAEILLNKVELALQNNLSPVYCMGEDLATRKVGNHLAHIQQQIEDVIFKLTAEKLNEIVLAYEPIWAIGTGETASAEQAQEVHGFIRKIMTEKFGAAGNDITILYGGSCKPSNAPELFSQPDIDGGLIGGASLNAADFIAISNSF